MLQGHGTSLPVPPPTLTARLQVNDIMVLLSLLRREFRAVFASLGSIIRVATFYGFALTLKCATWLWLL
jgi:hypothetical protein